MPPKNSFIDSLLKSSTNPLASRAVDGIAGADITHWVDTGSYTLNALLSGSLYKGIAGNKIIMAAGDPSTGKTFYSLEMAKNFLDSDPTSIVAIFYSESDVGKKAIEDRNLDSSRVLVFPVSTVEQFRTESMKLLEAYEENEDRPKMMMILDSMGNLSTNKETKDVTEGNDKRDMTKQQLLRGAFRVLTLKLGVLAVPLIIVNHVYSVVGAYVPTKEVSGGDGAQFAASQILLLSKKFGKEKSEGKDVHIGSIITVKLKKSRFTIENKKVETLIRFDHGLDRYYGLLPLAEKFGIVKKVSTRYEFPDGRKVFESEIEKNPEEYFTKEILDAIDAKCPDEFCFGSTNFTGTEDDNN